MDDVSAQASQQGGQEAQMDKMFRQQQPDIVTARRADGQVMPVTHGRCGTTIICVLDCDSAISD